MVNFPVFFTSAVARSTNASISPETAFLSKSVFADKASAIPLFGIAFTDFMAFIPFIAFMATIPERGREELRSLITVECSL